MPCLRIEITWFNGILADDELHLPPAEPLYELLDHETGKILAPGLFLTCQALEAYIDKHYPGCQRAPLPVAPPDEVAKAEKLLNLAEHPPADFNPQHLRAGLTGQNYQWAYPKEIEQRLRRALGLMPLE